MTAVPQASRPRTASPGSPAYELLRAAIERRESVTLHHHNYVRFLSPHALGTDASARPALLAYQYGGGKVGGLRVTGEWVCIPLSQLPAARPNSDSWNAGRGVAPPALCLREVELAADPVLRRRSG